MKGVRRLLAMRTSPAAEAIVTALSEVFSMGSSVLKHTDAVAVYTVQEIKEGV